jgi:hypothetical protein
MRATKNTVMHTVQGWVILHPDGWVETDYFHRQGWDVEGSDLLAVAVRDALWAACKGGACPGATCPRHGTPK